LSYQLDIFYFGFLSMGYFNFEVNILVFTHFVRCSFFDFMIFQFLFDKKSSAVTAGSLYQVKIIRNDQTQEIIDNIIYTIV